MALVSCRECKREISDQATACPHCGAPRVATPPPKKSSGCAVVVLTLLAIFFGLALLGWLGRSGSTTSSSDADASVPAATAQTAPSTAPAYAVQVISFGCYSDYGRDRAKITVRNTGTETIPFAQVFVSFKGKSGDVLYAGDSYFDPTNIPPGSTASAEVYSNGGGAHACAPTAIQDGHGAAVTLSK